MSKNQTVIMIKIIVILLVIISLYNLLPLLRSLYPMILLVIHKNFQVELNIVLYWIFFTIIFIAIDLLKLISAYGIFRIKNWGRKLAIITLLVDCLIRLYGIIKIFALTFKQIIDSPPVIKEIEGTTAAVISIWPTYIITILNLIFIIILLKKSIKIIFEQSNEKK